MNNGSTRIGECKPCGIGGFLLSVLSMTDFFNACVKAGVHSKTNTYIDASNNA